MVVIDIWICQRQGSKITGLWWPSDLIKVEHLVTASSVNQKTGATTLTLKGVWSVRDLISLGVDVKILPYPFSIFSQTSGYQPGKLRRSKVTSLKPRVPYDSVSEPSSIRIDLKRRMVGRGVKVRCELIGTDIAWERDYQDLLALDAGLVHFSRFLSFLQNFETTLPEVTSIEVSDATLWSILNREVKPDCTLTERRRRRIITQLGGLGVKTFSFGYTRTHAR